MKSLIWLSNSRVDL